MIYLIGTLLIFTLSVHLFWFSMKKVLFISPQQYGYMSDHYYLSRYAKDKYDLTFLCFDKGYKKQDAQGIKLEYMDFSVGKIKRSICFIRKALSLCKERKFDVVFCADSKLSLFLGMLINMPLKILDIRTGGISHNVLKRYWSNKWTQLTSLFFDRVTIISEELRDKLNLPVSKCALLPLGASIIDSSSKVYDKLNLVYVGILQLREIEKTIEGLALFMKKNGDLPIRYDIIGFGRTEDEERIKNSIANNKLEKIVTFHGRKNHSELQPFFEKATVGVCFIPQTAFYDIQPSTKLFEYAMSGLITIATNTFANKKYITHLNGVLCNDTTIAFANGLENICENLNDYSEKDIRNSLADFSWKNIFWNKLEPVLAGT